MQEYQDENLVEEVPVVKKRMNSKRVAGLLLLVLVGFGSWAYYQKFGIPTFNKSTPDKKLSEADQKALVSNYLAQVGKHMILPQGDEPVVATVDNPEALVKQQAFFLGSVKGDIVLIFPKTQRAILYSPSRNKIVNAGPVIAGNQNKSDTGSGDTETVKP
ncbi:MAG TPA: hypothetical protein VJ579_04640 [Candidatus Paceibacterota bacterium]|nr:hypothetical protein [Candidatus Paceibacterota bacterium]